MQRGRWTRQEDDQLLAAVRAHGFGGWEQIARQVEGRTPEQVARRAYDVCRGHSFSPIAPLLRSARSVTGKKRQKRDSVAGDPPLNATNNPFHLVDPLVDQQPPFRVSLSLEVLLAMDLHVHLSYLEVIGMLGGRFDGTTRTLHVGSVFPCKSLGSSLECEMDPVSEIEACERFRQAGLEFVGWYHSHPTFKPSPSLRDIETQSMYQAALGDLPVFVGIILSPYHSKSQRAMSRIEAIYIGDRLDCSGSFRTVCRCVGLFSRADMPVRCPVDISTDGGDSVDEWRLGQKNLIERYGRAKDRPDLLPIAHKISRRFQHKPFLMAKIRSKLESELGDYTRSNGTAI